MTAPATGTLHIKVEEDETVQVGDVIAILEEGEGAGSAPTATEEEVEEEIEETTVMDMASPAARN